VKAGQPESANLYKEQRLKSAKTCQKKGTEQGETNIMKTVLRLSLLFFVLALLVSTTEIAYAQWNGIVPYKTTRGEVLAILGEPSYDSGLVMIYDKDRAPADTNGAAIYIVNGTVTMVRIIPLKNLSEGDISGTFGKPATVSFRNPNVEEQVFNSPTGKVVVMFTKQDKRAIRIDYF
jgi:hypothetical protein